MPIKFRCPNCHQFLGISRSKAGEISDCPMCGKTLRVPDLDGTVKPLPTPELNLEDSSLVDALGELAGIGSRTEAVGPVHSGTGEVHVAGERMVAKPIRLEPLAPAKPVGVAQRPAAPPKPQSTQETAASVSGADGTIDDPNAELRTIANAPASARRLPKSHSYRHRPVDRRRWVERAAIAGICLLIGFGLAHWLAPARLQPASRPDSNQAVAQADPKAAAGNVDGTPAVTGRVTYVTESGDTRPDEGARIIALPEERQGTVKLDVLGVLVGSADADARVAGAALRALGGDIQTADALGTYQLNLDQSGAYQLLVISRHQSRPWENDVEENAQELLGRFFIRPSTLLGQLAYNLRQFQYRGHGTATRDFAFERE